MSTDYDWYDFMDSALSLLAPESPQACGYIVPELTFMTELKDAKEQLSTWLWI